MAYWLDEGWHCWPEVVRAGTAAAGLYARCGAYIAATTKDGLVPTEVARMYGTPEWIGRLVDVGLWSVEEHGFRDTRFFELNATREEIEKRRAAAAARQRKSRSSRAGHSDVTRDQRATHDTPVPSPPSPKGEGKGRLQVVPDWCRRCHPDTRMYVDAADQSVPCSTCHPNRGAA
jgi:hypothetical protein